MIASGSPRALRRHPFRRLPVLLVGLQLCAALPAQESPTPRFPSDSNFTLPPLRPVVICFPPAPPPLDRAISHIVPLLPPRFSPPAELEPFINETFYAPLSTWLLEKKLTAKMRDRIDAWRVAKANVLTELRATLDQQREAESMTRRHALEALAQHQTPPLAALERDAEQIRAELAISDYDWRAAREWNLGGKSRRGDSPAEIAATMRAYVYYQSGLSIGQRGLLREIYLELVAAAEDTAAAEAAQPFLFFLPEPARVLLPDDMPADLAAKVAAYQTKKSALKKELYDTVYKEDSASLAFMRNSSLKSLAERQSARLAELDRLAEDIRHGLAALPSPSKRITESSPLPPVITERLDAVVRASAAQQKGTTQRIDAVRAQIADEPIRLTYNFDASGLRFTVMPSYQRVMSPAEMKIIAEKLRPRLKEIEDQMTVIADDFGRSLVELINESNEIRNAAGAALGNPNPRAVEAALAAARRATALKDSAEAYREYRLAVFEPGMSPEQRRLLFGGALEKLELPLLRGELQPVARSANW